MNLTQLHQQYSATLADDGIPLHYDDMGAEWHAAQEHAILLDRSHEARVELHGASRFEVVNRISTNALTNLQAGEGRPTIFTNNHARILERVIAYHRDDERLLILAAPGHNAMFAKYLQRNIFFNDQARVVDVTGMTHQFSLHGQQAQAIITALVPDAGRELPFYGVEAQIAGHNVYVVRRKPLRGTHWAFIVGHDAAADVYQAIHAAGQAHGLQPAGSLIYNALRIQAGFPAGRELSQDFLPLEVGLWDEVSFTKGCYTGQEIIARMESRGRLAKTLVALSLEEMADAPATIQRDGRKVGTLTSSAQAPDGAIYALGVVKVAAAQPGTELTVAEIPATVKQLVGTQAPYILQED